MTWNLSHFTAALVFAFFASIVFAITQKNTPKEMLRHGLICFPYFIVGMVAAGWAMWLLKH